MATLTIDEMYIGETSEIVFFDGNCPEVKRLRNMGIRVGKLVDLIYYDPFISNKIVLGVDNMRIAFDTHVANKIKVRPIKSYYETIKTQAHYDPLTGCFNRNATEQVIRDEYEKFIDKDIPMMFFLVDIDYFKKINDTYGHAAGDEVLKGVAKMLKWGLRRSDVLCRWGGEEFLIILRGTALQNGVKIAERLRQKIESHAFPPFQKGGSVTVSIGGAGIVPDMEIPQLIEKADANLYKAKNDGRNRVVV